MEKLTSLFYKSPCQRRAPSRINRTGDFGYAGSRMSKKNNNKKKTDESGLMSHNKRIYAARILASRHLCDSFVRPWRDLRRSDALRCGCFQTITGALVSIRCRSQRGGAAAATRTAGWTAARPEPDASQRDARKECPKISLVF